MRRAVRIRKRLSIGSKIARVIGWVTLVPAMIFAVVLLMVGGMLLQLNVVTGTRADTVAGDPANSPTFRPTKSDCDQVRSHRQEPTTGHDDVAGSLRVFALQYTLDVDDVRTYGTWRTAMRCLMEELVQPYRRPGQPTIVVYTEDGGLPTIALGQRGSTVRAQAHSPLRAVSEAIPLGIAGALGQLNIAYGPQVSAYQAMFGPIDPRKELFVAATDTFVRAVNITFSEIAKDYGVYVVISNNQAPYRETHNPAEVALFADPAVQPTDTAYVATSQTVTNTTFFWGPKDVDPSAPDGMTNQLFANHKVPLTAFESGILGLNEGPATGVEGRRNAGGVEVAGFKVGFATSLPAFTYGYPFGSRPVDFQPCADTRLSFAACQDAEGVTLQIQADANPGRWPSNALSGTWQPLEWMSSVDRAVTDPTVNFAYNVTPMMNGNLFDLVFDGQSSITSRHHRGKPQHFIGNETAQPSDAHDMHRYAGPKDQFLAMTRWSGETPENKNNRAALMQIGTELAPHGSREDDYIQTAIYADLIPPERAMGKP